MKKVIVIGCPGSGKSTVSRALHNKTGIPLYHLDMMYWNADKTTVAYFLNACPLCSRKTSGSLTAITALQWSCEWRRAIR